MSHCFYIDKYLNELNICIYNIITYQYYLYFENKKTINKFLSINIFKKKIKSIGFQVLSYLIKKKKENNRLSNLI